MNGSPDRVDYQTEPSRYKHWKLKFDGPVATLLADFDENGGLRPGYKLKLNSYDLGVDIELNDAINRIRFERPEVRTVVITSARERVFCSGANIFMLGASSHAWKVNFCKFTNETRNGLEDSSARRTEIPGRGQRLLRGRRLRAGARLRRDHSHRRSLERRQPARGAAARRVAGNGRIDAAHRQAPCPPRSRRRLLHDERRRARREGFELAPRRRDRQAGAVRGQGARAGAGPRGDERPPASAKGVALTPIERVIEADALRYSHVTVAIDRGARAATFTIKGPNGPQPLDVAAIEAAGAAWYPLALARELEDAILSMRTNELDIGFWLIKTRRRPRGGDGDGCDAAIAQGPLARAGNDRLSAPHVQSA